MLFVRRFLYGIKLIATRNKKTPRNGNAETGCLGGFDRARACSGAPRQTIINRLFSPEESVNKV